ncbi:MAG: hypothetical protein GX657_01365 [Chloroflexi bacterium]|nr:hypothetical protein [Chloroflexota bacterium]
MAEITIAGFGIVVLVVLVMELAKRLWPGLRDQAAIAATIGVGVVLAYAALLMDLYPTFAQWATPLVLGVVAAASAAGLYSWGKKRE